MNNLLIVDDDQVLEMYIAQFEHYTSNISLITVETLNDAFNILDTTDHIKGIICDGNFPTSKDRMCHSNWERVLEKAKEKGVIHRMIASFDTRINYEAIEKELANCTTHDKSSAIRDMMDILGESSNE